jgi:PAS domain S-box-containing protein
MAITKRRPITYYSRYLAVSLIPVVLLLGAVFKTATKLGDDINFTSMEIDGVHELESYYDYTILLQRIRDFRQLQWSGVDVKNELEAHEDSLKKSLSISIQEPHAKTFGVVTSLEALSREFSGLTQQGDGDGLDLFHSYTDLEKDFLNLTIDVAERSNLALDHNRGTHRIVNLLATQSPRLTSALATLRGLALHGSVDEKHLVDVTREKQRAADFFYDRLADFNVELEKMAQDYSGQNSAVIDDLRKDLAGMALLVERVNNPGVTATAKPFASPRQLFDEVSAVIAEMQQNYSQLAAVLSERLLQRRESEEQRLTILVLGSALALLFFLATILGLYLRNRRAMQEVIESQERLSASRRMLRTVLDTIPERVFWKDRQGIYLGCNKLFATDAGFDSPDDVVDKTDADMVWGEQAERYYRDDLQVIDEGVARMRVEEQQDRPSYGHPWIEISKVPLYDSQNNIIGVLGAYHDITERKQAEFDLHESELRQRSIFESVIDGLITIDDHGIVQDFNPAAEKIFGYPAAEVVGRNINMLMPEKYANDHDNYLRNYNESGYAKIIGIGRELEGRRKDGTIFPIDLAVNELWIGERHLYSGIVRDITERKRVDKMKNEFVSTVSHELRTPLTSIRGSLGLLTGEAVGQLPSQALEMVKIASNNTERLLILINDILDIQKIESGMMAFHFENLDLNEFLKEALHDHSVYAEQHGVHFVLQRELKGVRVFADRDRLMQVLANLMSNAAKFSPPDSAVEIGVERSQGAIRVSVTDHGPGIPEEFMPKLFHKFTQVDSSDARQKGGTGLGLAIAKAITEKHGGKIGVKSTVGEGTTFYFDLPEVISEINPFEPCAVGPVAGDQQSAILIVEDDADLAQLIQGMMIKAGYAADVAHDAVQAHRLLVRGRHHYGLMICDIMLPDEDGMSFIASLRQDKTTESLPVVVVSVKAEEVKQNPAENAMGVLEWIPKPFDEQRLVNVIKSVIKPGFIPRVLHVEDDTDVHKVVANLLGNSCEIIWAASLEESKEMLMRQNFDLVLLDVGLPDGSGLDLLEVIKQHVKPPRVVIFSARDVSPQYARLVNTVLVKSRTSNQQLYDVLTSIFHDQTAGERYIERN